METGDYAIGPGYIGGAEDFAQADELRIRAGNSTRDFYLL